MDAGELISRYRPQGETETRDTERVRALLRAADDADGATSEPNLRETLSRVRQLLAH